VQLDIACICVYVLYVYKKTAHGANMICGQGEARKYNDGGMMCSADVVTHASICICVLPFMPLTGY
jgi:hypothetical protein